MSWAEGSCRREKIGEGFGLVEEWQHRGRCCSGSIDRNFRGDHDYLN